MPARPLADDDRRDFEIHIRRHFLETLAVQLKTSKRLRPHGRSRLLQIDFRLKAPLVNDKRLWYFLAHLRVKAMRYTDPVFLVPSEFFNEHALHGIGRGMIQMQFKASMEPSARDLWSRWLLQWSRGRQILQLLGELAATPAPGEHAADLILLPGVVWLGQPGVIPTVRRRRAA